MKKNISTFALTLVFALLLSPAVQAKNTNNGAAKVAVKTRTINKESASKSKNQKRHRSTKSFNSYSSTQLYTRLWFKMRVKKNSDDEAQIRLLQIGLNKLGANLKVSGRFDRPTQKALRVVQDANGIPADGYWFGKRTAQIINSALNKNNNKSLFAKVTKPFKWGVTKIADKVHHRRESDVEPTFYSDSESGCDVDTKNHRGAFDVPLSYGDANTSASCAADPEYFRPGDQIKATYPLVKVMKVKGKKGRVHRREVFVKNSRGKQIYVTRMFTFVDVGGAVFGQVASQGKKPVIDFYSRDPVYPVSIQVIPYTGVESLLDKPSILRRQFTQLSNWRNGVYRPPSLVSN